MLTLPFGLEVDVMLQIYPTHGLHAALFGEHYSKFYDAFKQGLSTAEAHTAVATTVPAKRAAATPKQATKRRKRDDHASLPRSTQHHAPMMPVQTPAAATTMASRRTKSIELASSSDMARETPVASQPRSDLETNGKSPSMGFVILPLLYELPPMVLSLSTRH